MFRSVRNALLLCGPAITILIAIGAASAQDSGAQTPVPPATMPQTARIALLGAGAHRPISNSSSNQDDERTPVTRESALHLIKEGKLIKIPQGSPLRGELAVAAVAAKEMQRTLKLHAVIEADPSRTVQVLPPVAGRVVDLKVQLGDRVAQNQELAVVYTRLAHAYSGDRRTRSAPVLPNEPTAGDRQIALQRIRSDAAADCQQAEAEPVRSIARRCALVTEGVQETHLLSLKAPVAGSVIDLEIRPGTALDDPSASIMTIADLDTVWVTTSLPNKDTALIATGWPVEIAFVAYPNEVFTGAARFISNMRDPDAYSFKVRVELQNPSRRLKPNMFALATFFWPKETVPVIPTTALIQKSERGRVFVEVEQWTFEARPVEVGFAQGDQTVVVGGLNIGERIVVRGGALLDD